MRLHNAYAGIETRLGTCVFFFRPTPKRPPGKWRGPAEVLEVERDAVALPHKGGIRKVPRNRAKSFVSPRDHFRDGPIGPPPMAVKHHMPDRFGPPISSLEAARDSPPPTGVGPEEKDAEGTVAPTHDTPTVKENATGPDEKVALDDLVDLPGRALQQKCSNLGYHRRESKRKVAMKTMECLMKGRARNDASAEPKSPVSSKRPRAPDIQNEEHPMKKTAQSLFVAEKFST